MSRIFPILKNLFALWGIVALIGLLVFVTRFANTSRQVDSIFASDSKSSSVKASKDDVSFVLNWCRLGDDRFEEVINSYISGRSFTGDHLDAHAIRIVHVSPDELTLDGSGEGWHRCDQLKGVLIDALDFVGGWSSDDNIQWFPSKEELLSSSFYVYPWSIYCHGTRPTAVELIFVRPSDRMVFYIGSKT